MGCLRLTENFGVHGRKLLVEVRRHGFSTVKLICDPGQVGVVDDLKVVNDRFPFVANCIFLLCGQAEVSWLLLGLRQRMQLKCGLCAFEFLLDDVSVCSHGVELMSKLRLVFVCSLNGLAHAAHVLRMIL